MKSRFIKILTVLMAFFLAGSLLDVQAYQAGVTTRPNFGAQQTEGEDEDESSVPGARSRVKTRTFSNYGARQQWGKGGQTKTVQTGGAVEQKGELTQTGATDKFSKSKPETKADKAKGKLKSAKRNLNKTKRKIIPKAPMLKRPNRPKLLCPQKWLMSCNRCKACKI